MAVNKNINEDRARFTESVLRKIIREEIKGSSPKARDGRRPAGAMSEGQLPPAAGLGDGIEEKGTSDYYTLHVLHSKTFEIPGRDPITVPDYETSELRARVRDGMMEIVSVYVPESQRGKGLATKMVLRAAEWGRSEGLEIVSSGVYSDSGRGLARSFVDRGEASKIAARFEGAARPRARGQLSESDGSIVQLPAQAVWNGGRGGWEYDLPGFANWPEFLRRPKSEQLAWAREFAQGGIREPVDVTVHADGGLKFQDGHHRVIAAALLGGEIPARVKFVNFSPDRWPDLLALLRSGYTQRDYNPQGWSLKRTGVPPLSVVAQGPDAADDWIQSQA